MVGGAYGRWTIAHPIRAVESVRRAVVVSFMRLRDSDVERLVFGRLTFDMRGGARLAG